MAKIYYNLIKQNLWSIDNVPGLWKDDVQALLDADKEKENNERTENTTE